MDPDSLSGSGVFGGRFLDAWLHRQAIDQVLESDANAWQPMKKPGHTVPEAAALLSRSREHLYRLIRAGAFPAVGMTRGRRGDYVVPAKAVEAMLDAATANGVLVSAGDFSTAGGAA